MVMGARQVGKSYIIRRFGENEYQNFIEINLFQRKDIVELYKGFDTSENKYKILTLLLNIDMELTGLIACLFFYALKHGII